MTFCFILASTDGRTHILNECVKALKKSKYKNADIFLYYQGTNINEIDDISFFKGVVLDKNMRGVFTPRYELIKRFGILYDYTIIIDDDLFVTKYTNYELAIKAIANKRNVGCVTTPRNVSAKSLKNKLIYVDHTNLYYASRFNIEGGIIFPRESCMEIINFFSGKEADYSEDMFWLLLYCKGYDLYFYMGSTAIHRCDVPNAGGKPSGYIQYIHEHKYKPILTEWYDTPKPWTVHGKTVTGMKMLYMINQEGLAERERNQK